MRCVKVTRRDLGSHFITDTPSTALEELEIFIENDEVGCMVLFEIVEMTQEEYDGLKEFTGW
jgi:hypothetical protein